jgi:uncharacterized protein (DUF58 family)
MMPAFGRPQPASTQPAPSVAPAAEGVVRIGLPALIALHHDAATLSLKPGAIRSPVSGGYRSAFKGRGMEFDEVRPYMQGDDVRTLDWRVTARTGRPHTKLYREERERAVLLALDLRPAMLFATRGAFKAVRAAQAAALLGWAALDQGDRLGMLLFSAGTHVELRPRRGKAAWLQCLNRIATHPAWQAQSAPTSTSLNPTLLRLRRVAQPGSLIVLLSDFTQLDAAASTQLAELARHNELLLVAIHDPLEAELPPPGQYRLSDGQHYLTLLTDDPTLRARYRAQYTRQQADLQQLCRRYGMHYLALSTAESPLRALQRGLAARQ